MIKQVHSEEDLTYFGHTRAEMLQFVPDECNNILELGCGEGRFASLLKQQRECTYHGIELFEDAAARAESILEKVYTGSVENVLPHLPDDAYDCIICNDVLEHLSNPFTCLRDIKRILQPGGYIVSSIPNVRYINNLRELLFKKDWQYRHEGGILDFTHLRFFTMKSIRRMYEETGYTVLRNEGIDRIEDIRFSFLNAVTLGYFSDTLYPQIATVAQVKG